MKVFILYSVSWIEDWYETNDLVGVFSTYEKAMSAMRKRKEIYRFNTEQEYYTNGVDFYAISEETIDKYVKIV